MKHLMKRLMITAPAITVAGGALAAPLYSIDSFNNNGSTSTSVQWIAGITTIVEATGVTGTTDAELLTLQTASTSPTTAVGGTRFRNTESGNNNARQSLTIDTTGYFQFGVTADSDELDLTSLTFETVRATTSDSARGYDIDVSVNGGTYVDLSAANVANNRNDGLQIISIDLSGAAYQGITSIDFRFAATGGGIEWTNIDLNGEVVPEPSALSLLGLGGLLIARRRRG